METSHPYKRPTRESKWVQAEPYMFCPGGFQCVLKSHEWVVTLGIAGVAGLAQVCFFAAGYAVHTPTFYVLVQKSHRCNKYVWGTVLKAHIDQGDSQDLSIPCAT